MIRAVSRYTLEINRTGSPYFERAICFVRPEFAQSDRLDLHRAAQQLIADFDAGVEEQSTEGELCALSDAGGHCAPDSHARGKLAVRLLRFLPLGLSAIIGAGITLLIMLAVL